MKSVLWNSRKLARLSAAVLLIASIAAGFAAKARKNFPDATGAPQTGAWTEGAGLRARAELSQSKVVAGSDGRIYLKIDIEGVGKSGSAVDRRPTDFIVVLDRSGSMAERNKMDYARKAVEQLLGRMGENDRFALVAFDDVAEIPVALTPVNAASRSGVAARLASVGPRGGTNLGIGLEEGIRIANSVSRDAARSRRILLLSDGLANAGVTSTEALGATAAQAVAGEFTVSTIGLGLDFNETLMAALADRGLGNYHFLESVASLESVLAREFQGAASVLAERLELRFDLAAGVRIADAAGYPVEKESGASVVRPGHLYAGQSRTLYVTLDVPTGSVYSEPLGSAELAYTRDGAVRRLPLLSPETLIACVPAGRKDEATASINKPVYERAWTENNFGSALKGSAAGIANGDAGGALGAISAYRDKLEEAYEQAPSPKMKAVLDGLGDDEAEIRDAFAGPDAVEKQKRLSKTQHAAGGEMQR